MRWLLLFVFVPVAFGQLDSDTLTITSSRILNVAVDQVQVTVNVNTATDASLDDVLSVLKETEITIANLSGVYTWSPIIFSQPRPTQWTFVLTEPLSKLKGTLGALARVQSRSAIDLGYFLNTVPTSSDTCVWPSLVSDAQAQAQKLAAVAGVRVGPIVTLSDRPESGRGVSGALLDPTSAISIARAGDFSQIVPAYTLTSLVGYPSFLLGTVSPAPSCSLTVQFKLLR